MPDVAYGFFEGFANGHRTLHHSGDGGSHSLIWLMPDSNTGVFVVYTTPTAGDPAEPRAKAAATVADWLFSTKPFTLPPPPPDFVSRAARFVGIYRPNQIAVTTLEKLAALPAQIRVTDLGHGSLGLALGLGADRNGQPDARPTRRRRGIPANRPCQMTESRQIFAVDQDSVNSPFSHVMDPLRPDGHQP